DRRRFFENLAQSALPFVGYKLLCLMAEAGIIKSIWTTNFDGLAARAAASFNVAPVEVGLDSAHRAFRTPNAGELLCVSIHGDYRYDKLKNTEREMQQQDARLREAFATCLRDSTLIVSGYSGRDRSVMETLNRAYSQVGPARLYWCGREGEDILDSVQKLLLTARSHGREAYYVPTFGFDDLLLRLSMHCLSGNLLQRARQLYEANSKQTEQDSPPFAVESHNVTRLIKSNAFSVECPSELFQFRVPCLNGQGAWKLLREMISGTGIAAGLLRQNVVALGTLDEIKQVFDGKVEGEIARTPITNRELAITDGVILHILTQGILRGLAQRSGLEADERKNLIWDRKEPITERVNGTDCLVYEAATLFLRRYGGKQYLIIKPTIHGTSKAGTSLPGETIKELKRRKLTGQYNRQFNEATNAWRKKLFASSPIVLEFPPNSGSAFRFNISSSPAFAGISTVGAEKSLKISEPVRQMVLHKGLEINEPMLIFSNKQADGAVKDPNPIRGIVRNRPYDYVLTRQGLQEIVRVGVICS